jgi:hypothetical protein
MRQENLLRHPHGLPATAGVPVLNVDQLSPPAHSKTPALSDTMTLLGRLSDAHVAPITAARASAEPGRSISRASRARRPSSGRSSMRRSKIAISSISTT